MRLFTLLTMILLITSCSRNRHLTGDYMKYANSHRTVAVLPYDITIIGKDARELTPDQLDLVILEESELFQQSLYSEVLKRTGRRDKDIQISVLDIRRTNRLLDDAGIDGLNIGEYSANEIGKILSVDAVVTTRLIKEGFLNRETAMIADVLSTSVLDKIDLPISILANRRKLTRASKVDIYAYIVDTDSDKAVWQYNTECDLDWELEPSEVIESINGSISKNFPYRK